jgi:hypothetical protein
MNSPAYAFILNMWIMRKVDEVYVQSKVPTRITQTECDMILLTPQMTVEEIAAKTEIV